MPYRTARNRTSKMFKSGAYTGATYSGGQNIIRHSHQASATIQAGYTQCFNLVICIVILSTRDPLSVKELPRTLAEEPS